MIYDVGCDLFFVVAVWFLAELYSEPNSLPFLQLNSPQLVFMIDRLIM